jgi:hypothetical protein
MLRGERAGEIEHDARIGRADLEGFDELRGRLRDAAAFLQDHAEIVVRFDIGGIKRDRLAVFPLGPVEPAVQMMPLGLRREIFGISALRKVSPLDAAHECFPQSKMHLGASWLTKSFRPFVQHDLFGKPYPLFRIMLWPMAQTNTRAISVSGNPPAYVESVRRRLLPQETCLASASAQ